MDKVTLERIELLHPILRQEAKEIYAEICRRLTGRAMCRFTFTLRTFAEQDEIYSQGRTKMGIACKCNGKTNKEGECLKHPKGLTVTKARGGQSFHNYGLAIDAALLIDIDGNGTFETLGSDIAKDYDGDNDSDWQEIVFVFKMHGWEWGGDWATFKDFPHFQKTFGLTIAQALKYYSGGNLIAGTNYIKIGI